jgi:UDP-N-acetylmuramoyl-tripeptide--D-alanyl-D-alanine ligase
VPRRLAAVTGSAGKTTTKELLVAMLKERFRTAGSPGNLNNLYGFPLALLAVPDDTEWMVAETAMSTPGELGEISRLARPDAAVFTNVRLVHLAAFDREGREAGLDQIRDAKAELLEGLAPDGLVVANAADPNTVDIALRHRQRGGVVRWFALDPAAATEAPSLTIEDLRREGPSGARFRVADRATGERAEVTLRLHGAVALENFLAAATCAHAVGVPLEAIAAGAAKVRPQPGRGRVLSLQGDAVLIDDCYNSNPDALARAIGAAFDIVGRRHWAVLGAMGELGRRSEALHRAAGTTAARSGLELVIGVGEAARPLVDAAANEGARTAWFPDAGAASSFATSQIEPGDVVLVKGSRSVGLERVVEAILSVHAAHGGDDASELDVRAH